MLATQFNLLNNWSAPLPFRFFFVLRSVLLYVSFVWLDSFIGSQVGRFKSVVWRTNCFQTVLLLDSINLFLSQIIKSKQNSSKLFMFKFVSVLTEKLVQTKSGPFPSVKYRGQCLGVMLSTCCGDCLGAPTVEFLRNLCFTAHQHITRCD